MPRDPQGRADTLQWVIAGLTSIKMVTVPWWFLKMSGVADTPLDGWVRQRFKRLNAVLTGYLPRACSRPGFLEARDEQMAHFRAGDAGRG